MYLQYFFSMPLSMLSKNMHKVWSITKPPLPSIPFFTISKPSLLPLYISILPSSLLYGSFFQSSLSQTGCANNSLIREVPLNALVNGRCPSGAFFTSYVNSPLPNHFFFLSTSPSVVVHPIFLQKASKSSLLCLYFFYFSSNALRDFVISVIQ